MIETIIVGTIVSFVINTLLNIEVRIISNIGRFILNVAKEFIAIRKSRKEGETK